MEEYNNYAVPIDDNQSLHRPSLLSLPISVLSLILTSFLKIEDVSKLEASFCNDKRDALLRMLSDNKYIVYDHVILERKWTFLDRALIWIGKRKINIRNVSIISEEYGFGDNSNLTDNGLLGLSRHCANLQSFEVIGSYRMTPRGFAQFSNYCTNLESLNIGYCHCLTEISVIDFVSNCVCLKSLDFSYLDCITDTGIILIARHCNTNLQSLCIEECENVSDDGCIEVARLCPNLKSLVISNCHRIAIGKSIEFSNLAKYFTNLQSLKITSEIYGDDIVEIGKHCTNLQSLKLDARPKDVTSNHIVELIKRLTNLQSLRLCHNIWYLANKKEVEALYPNLNLVCLF